MASGSSYSAREALELDEEGSDMDMDFECVTDYSDNDDSDEFPLDDNFENSTNSDTDSDEDSGATNGHSHDAEAVDAEVDDGEVDDAIFTVDLDDEDQEWLYDWTNDLSNYPLTAPFTGNPGLSLPHDFPDKPTPVDFYRLIVDEYLIRLMKTETNRYAKEICARKQAEGGLDERSMYTSWKDLTNSEMMRFIAILIHMGLVKKTHISDYWSTDPSVRSEFASQLLTRERFCSILAFFHLNNSKGYIPSGEEGHDTLFKVRPLIHHLSEKYRALYTPQENISMDKAVCPFSLFHVSVGDKRVKRTLKLHEICESSSGYVINLKVVCDSPETTDTSLDICWHLVKPLLNLGHTLYVDKVYCDPCLVQTLSAENTQVVGPVWPHRWGLPKDLVSQSMEDGEMDYRRKNQTVCVRWKERGGDILMLTTKHYPVTKAVQSARGSKEKPVCALEYVANMAGGKSRSDQVDMYLPLQGRTLALWKKLALRLLTQALVQSHILCSKHRRLHRRKRISLHSFVKAVCGTLVEGPLQDEYRLRARTHWPAWIPKTRESQTRKTQKGCKVCYAQHRGGGATSEQLRSYEKCTSMMCKQCKVPLCAVPCFELFHTVKDYSLPEIMKNHKDYHKQ